RLRLAGPGGPVPRERPRASGAPALRGPGLRTRPMPDAPAPPNGTEPPPVWPYILPLAGFLALTAAEGYVPGPGWYPAAYALKLSVVVALLWVCRGTLRDLLPLPGPAGAALAVGL